MLVVSLAGLLSCLGLLLSSLSLLPVVIIHLSHSRHAALLPFIPTLKETLDTEYQRERITLSTMQYLQNFLDLMVENAIIVSMSLLVLGTINIAMDFFLLIGSCCRIRWLMLPWLLVRMLELILVGGPLVIITDLVALYLSVKDRFLASLLVTSLPAILTILIISAWCLVLGAYVSLGQPSLSRGEEGRAGAPGVEQPVLSQHQPRHSQYTQFYRARHSHAQPHHPSDVNLYPTLPR